MKKHPIEFVKSNRFDVAAKYLYAKYREYNFDTRFAEDVYYQHLKVWNNFNEIDNENKNTFENFKETFHNIIDSIKNDGFDSAQGTLPITSDEKLLNGSHRLAASLLHDVPIECHVTETMGEGQLDCSGSYFSNRGLSGFYMDAMSTEYARLDTKTLVITFFPSATVNQQGMQTAEQMISEHCDIISAKTILWENNAPLNVARQLYLGESWGLNWDNNFSGFISGTALCFTNTAPMVAVLVVPRPHVDPVVFKNHLRDIFGLGKHSCHINDTHEETMRICRVFFNGNSIHHLNKSKNVFWPSFQSQFDYYKKYIKANNLDPENYCITASSVLSLYGLRQGQDLDYLHRGDEIYGHPDIHSHNQEIEKYTMSKDEIMFNPQNHFWHDGVKVASVNVVRSLKQKRGEPKDHRDIELMETL